MPVSFAFQISLPPPLLPSSKSLSFYLRANLDLSLSTFGSCTNCFALRYSIITLLSALRSIRHSLPAFNISCNPISGKGLAFWAICSFNLWIFSSTPSSSHSGSRSLSLLLQ